MNFHVDDFSSKRQGYDKIGLLTSSGTRAKGIEHNTIENNVKTFDSKKNSKRKPRSLFSCFPFCS